MRIKPGATGNEPGVLAGVMEDLRGARCFLSRKIPHTSTLKTPFVGNSTVKRRSLNEDRHWMVVRFSVRLRLLDYTTTVEYERR